MTDAPDFSHACERCGRHYVSHRRIQRFCSRECVYQSRLDARPRVKCPVCGKDFAVSPHDVSKVKHCSYACSNRGSASLRKHTPRVEKVCPQCGKSFQSIPGHNRKYCGDPCARIGRNLKVAITCPQCGKVRMQPPSQASQLFCSNECRGKAKVRRAEFICQTCGKKTLTVPKLAKVSRFCSRRCYQKYRGETEPERLTRAALTALGVIFEPQHAVSRYSLDFYLPAQNVDLEVDGDYWHRSDRQKGVDKRRDAFLSNRGIRTIRLAEGEIKKAKCIPSLIASRLGIKWQGQMALPF